MEKSIIFILSCVYVLFPYPSVLLPCKTLEESGLNVTMEDVPNTDHFSIIEQLVDGEYHLTKVHFKHKQFKVLVTMNIPECLPFPLTGSLALLMWSINMQPGAIRHVQLLSHYPGNIFSVCRSTKSSTH